MAGQAQILPGTLDLILKAVSLGRSTGTAFFCASSRSRTGRCSSNRVRSIQLCIAWSARDSSRQTGARPITIAAPSSTNSLQRAASDCATRPRAGIGSWLPSLPRSRRNRRSYETLRLASLSRFHSLPSLSV